MNGTTGIFQITRKHMKIKMRFRNTKIVKVMAKQALLTDCCKIMRRRQHQLGREDREVQDAMMKKDMRKIGTRNGNMVISQIINKLMKTMQLFRNMKIDKVMGKRVLLMADNLRYDKF